MNMAEKLSPEKPAASVPSPKAAQAPSKPAPAPPKNCQASINADTCTLPYRHAGKHLGPHGITWD